MKFLFSFSVLKVSHWVTFGQVTEWLWSNKAPAYLFKTIALASPVTWSSHQYNFFFTQRLGLLGYSIYVCINVHSIDLVTTQSTTFFKFVLRKIQRLVYGHISLLICVRLVAANCFSKKRNLNDNSFQHIPIYAWYIP